ncbi:hypothetical protein IJ765_01025 [Candidatus Saccharibacteria bacterium]|nr:hypothetical protein [Candidatus Saccharibacteria bacterium]
MNPQNPYQPQPPQGQPSPGPQPIQNPQPMQAQQTSYGQNYQRAPQGYNQFAQTNQGTPAFHSRNITSTSFAHNNQNYFTNVKNEGKPTFTPKEQYELFMNKHKKEVAIGGVILVAVILTIIMLSVSSTQRAVEQAKETETTEYVEEVTNHRTVEEIRESINPIFKEQGALMAIQEYEDQIYDAKTDEEKAMLYSERAKALHEWLIATGENYHTLILEDAYKAEKLNPTWETAYDIYRYETLFGSTEKAAEYAALAKERNPKLKIETIEGAG